MAAVLLALGAALGWGVSDFLGGLKSRSSSVLLVLLLSQTTALVLLSVLVAVDAAALPDPGHLGYAAVAGLSEAIGIAALYRGLSVGTMSVVAPVAATAPVLPLLAGLALGEVPGPLSSAGLVLAAIGVVITSVQRDAAGPAAVRVGPSVGYGLLAALGFGLFFLAMDAASEAGVGWALLVARLTSVTGMLLAVIGVWLRGRRPRARGADLPVVALIGLLIMTADFLYATATTQGLLGVAVVLGSLHTIVTIGLARVVLKERLDRLQRAGIVVVLLGVLAITGSSV
jgi:drug/metabolite transporter (DMT)-like permease